MILNLSIDDQIVQRAQKVAESRGMTLDNFVQHCLEDATPEAEPESLVEEWIEEFDRLTAQASAEEDISEFRRLSGLGDSGGWKFNREEIYDRGSKD